MDPDAMAELFDIPTGKTIEDDYNRGEAINSFDEVTKDMKSSTQDPDFVENKIIMDAIEEAGDSSDTVDADIESFQQEIVQSVDTKEISNIQESAQEDLEIPITVTETSNNDNPLNLDQSDLAVAEKIKKQFPQFNIYNGDRAFRDFYCYKLFFLKNVLTRFPVLDMKTMSDEVKNIDLDHFVQSDYIDPDLIRMKINDAYKGKTRLASLLMDVHEQYYAWERFLEMLRAKLWKDHEIKGAHRRDGSVLEHLSDMEYYVSQMKGFMESAKHCDAVLRAASDSLSRQLSCLEMKDRLGLNPQKVTRTETTRQTQQIKQDTKLSGLDEISDGTTISAPKATGPAEMQYADEDPIAAMGA